jgi:hypothetical protein
MHAQTQSKQEKEEAEEENTKHLSYHASTLSQSIQYPR